MTEENELSGIAIIGLAGRFPGANNIDQFWENLKNGVESIEPVTDEELLERGANPAMMNHPNYIKSAPKPLEDYDKFDAAFFGFSPKDALIVDPQHRIFFELAWEAMEMAGYGGEKEDRNIGVYAGASPAYYMMNNLMNNQEVLNSCDPMQLILCNDKDYLSSRTSYLLDLKGPSATVQAACASSLMAVHMACESIHNRECSMALAGGVALSVPQGIGYIYQPEGIMSGDGRCRAFDEKAQGTVFGSGAGVVVLKHLEDAVEDNDTIWAVLKGTAINNDGSAKVGFTAPSVEGQSEVIMKAITIAEIDPETIGYLETHGTGTAMGDPIEIEALTQAWRCFTEKTGFCSIGSLKSNIGHLEVAAGVSGLIKTVLTLKHGVIPPSINFDTPNSKIDFDNSPFQVNRALTPWARNGAPRRAAISSFGIGGTNVHAILEEAPTLETNSTPVTEPVIVPLSAKNANALERNRENLANFLEQSKDVNLADLAFTLQVGREAFRQRAVFHAKTVEELIHQLRSKEQKEDLPPLAKQWLDGEAVDWEELQTGTEKRIPLPTYSFERQRYWVDRTTSDQTTTITEAQSDSGRQSKQSEETKETIELFPRPEISTEYVAPRNELEEKLEDIWKEQLALEKIGVHDDFFELDGNSLMIVSIGARVQSQYRFNLEMEHFFENSTIAELAELIASEMAKGEMEGSKHELIPTLSREGELSLSLMQRRLWLIDQIHPGSTAHNIQVAVEITGEFLPELVQKSLDLVVARHEVLRTTFGINQDEEPILKVDQEGKAKLQYADLRNMPEAERKEELLRLLANDRNSSFDLSEGPLFRVSLIATEENRQVLSLSVHHIVFDGWSSSLFCQEILSNYQALAQNSESRLPELPIQYADYAQWHLENFQKTAAERLEKWVEKLEGADHVLNLPTDFTRPEEQSYEVDRVRFHLSGATKDKLNAFSQKQEATLFMTLFTAFQILLQRHSGQDDFLIGTAMGNRQREEVENLIGFFSNTLVLRTCLKENPTFKAMLRQVRKTTLESFKDQDLPYDQLVDAVQPERTLSRNPLFQSMFILQNMPLQLPDGGGLTTNTFDIDQSRSQLDLKLEVFGAPEGLSCVLEYSTDLFEKERIEAMAAQYQELINAILEAPEMPISRLSIMSETEKEQLLVAWNQTERDYPAENTTMELFEKQAEKTPNKVAIVFEEKSLTYAELDQKSNQMARYLIERGVTTGDLVAICLDRSLEMLIGLFAIMKAGAAYVPLDPIYPPDRLLQMLEDAQAKLLLTEARQLELFANETTEKVVWEEVADSVATLENIAPKTAIKAEDLAYVIYTSGSTGKPKGVQITHRNLVNFLYSMQEKPGLDANDVLVSVTTICFDIFGLELYLPLLFGGTHWLVSAETTMDGDLLNKELERAKATTMQATPTTWNMLLDSDWKPTAPFKALCGGEPIPRKLVQALTTLEHVELWNMYGPTETTIWSTVEQLTDGDKKITIGKPIANTIVHILDDHGNPVPVGTVGEIHIGGDGVAKGYLRREELTEQQFIDNPFHPEKGKLYRTGDLGQYLPDGNIECLGRRDQQVKIRGFRIELEDIEFHLNQQDAIQEAVVRIEGENDAKRLVACLVIKSDTKVEPDELRNALREKLPIYMVPNDYRVLESIPKTPNGKVDRKRLPRVKSKRLESEIALTPLQNETEKRIAQVWSRLLELEKIGRNQNFFDLGGHSMLIVRLAKELSKEFSKEVSVQKLFLHSTVQQQAEFLSEDEEKNRQELKEKTLARGRSRKVRRL